jgi:hypothetical protein
MPWVSPHRLGLLLGTLLLVSHLVWATLVASGWAQTVMDFVFRIHFIKPAYAIASFDAVTALLLIAITASVGYVTGFVLAALWNGFNKWLPPPRASHLAAAGHADS